MPLDAVFFSAVHSYKHPNAFFSFDRPFFSRDILGDFSAEAAGLPIIKVKGAKYTTRLRIIRVGIIPNHNTLFCRGGLLDAANYFVSREYLSLKRHSDRGAQHESLIFQALPEFLHIPSWYASDFGQSLKSQAFTPRIHAQMPFQGLLAAKEGDERKPGIPNARKARSLGRRPGTVQSIARRIPQTVETVCRFFDF